MSTEVTPESLRLYAKWAREHSEYVTAQQLDRKAEQLEREQRPLPTVPGWYPNIVVERGGESCTGAMLRDDGRWTTPRLVGRCYSHSPWAGIATVRWAEQDGKTPGQTAMEAFPGEEPAPWAVRTQGSRDFWERLARNTPGLPL